MTKPYLVLYHANCTDGFGAAYAAWCDLGDSADYVPWQYGMTTPPKVEGYSGVYVVDFSFSRDVLLDMAKHVDHLTIIDHHRTAERALAGIEGEAENIEAIFDQCHSGAVLTWDYFHPGTTPPLLLLYVQDRDLWRKALPYNEEVILALTSRPQTFEEWNQLAATGEEGIATLAQEGTIIRRYVDQKTTYLAERPPRARLFGYDVPCVNCPGFLASDVGHLLGEGEPFAATYTVSPTRVIVSLRSRPDGINVAALAERAGGGGHFHAAGFSFPLEADEFPLDGFDVPARLAIV